MKNNRNLTLLLGITFLSLITINCGPKKKVTKFEKPTTILFAKSNLSVPIFKKMESPDPSIGEIKEADSVQVLAKIEITRKDKSEAHYYEVKCPSRLKATCNEDEVYIKNLDLIAHPRKGTVIESDKLQDSIQTRDWITSPNKIDKVNFSKDAFELAMVNYKSPDDRIQFLGELLILLEIQKDVNYSDVRYDAVFKKYAVLNKRKPEEEARLIGLDDDMIKNLRTEVESEEKQILTGFPMRAQSYKGLVDQFNRLRKIPFIQEKILNEILKNSAYTLSGEAANAKLEFLGRDGVKITFTNAGVSEENTIESITALEDNGSIGFTLKLKDKEISLSPPTQTPSYFLAGGPGLKEFIANLPKDYKEILKNEPYFKAVMLVALKSGRGGYDETDGTMKFSFNTDKSGEYWKMLDIFRFHPNITRKGEYSGTFYGPYGASCGETEMVWRQPKGELYLGYINSKNCGGDGSLIEEICMRDGGTEIIEITFSPSELQSETPKIKITYEGFYGENCKSWINWIFNQGQY